MDNPFDTLGVPARFGLDPAELQSRYLTLSAQSHPDRFTDPVEQADAAERSARLNAAYRDLSDPESRARALLRLQPPPPPGHSAQSAPASSSADPSAMPPELLMELMERREEIEADLAADDTAAIQRHRDRAVAEKADLIQQIDGHFAASQVETAAVQQLLHQLRYVERTLESLPQ